MTQPQSVDVPEDYRRLGYSGLFYIEVPITAGHEESMRTRVPRLMKARGWLCVAVTDDNKAVLVRNDNYALADLMFGRPVLPR